MDTTAGSSWDDLCPFIGYPVPVEPFPRQNPDLPKGGDASRRAAEEFEPIVEPGRPFVLVDEDWLDPLLPALTGPLLFPRRDGVPWGLPDDDEAAVQELARMRQAGTGHIVFAWPAFWWFGYYRRFAAHLTSRFRRVLANDLLVVFDLRE